MKELPEGYTLQQAYNDILTLGTLLNHVDQFAENMWELMRSENFIQEEFFSTKMEWRMQELEDKMKGLMANYSSKYPLFEKMERLRERDEYIIK